jgi:protein MpaA
MNTSKLIYSSLHRYAALVAVSTAVSTLASTLTATTFAQTSTSQVETAIIQVPFTENPVAQDAVRRDQSTLVAPYRGTVSVWSESSEVFGHSVQGRPLRAHILGHGSDVTLIFAAVHGNETATPYLIQQLLLHLRRHPEILTNRRVLLIPTLNPDGLNRRSRTNARGVDINRNYPGTWRRPRRGERHRSGPSAASEPETRAMMGLVNKYRPAKIVSIHQPLHCITFSGERSRALAQAIAKANGYKLKDNIGYPTPGGFGGYCDRIIKTPVVTLELPWQSPHVAWKRNAPALIAAIRFRQTAR